VPLERSNAKSGRAQSPTPVIPTIIVTPPGPRLGSQKNAGCNEDLFSGSISEFFPDRSPSESVAGLGHQVPVSVPLSRSTSHYHSSVSKRRTSSKPQSSSLEATRSRSSDRYLQVPSPRRHRPGRLRRSAQVKPLDRGLSLDLTIVKPSFQGVERGGGRSPLWMHTDECPPNVTPMFERMMLDD
jgi:hypothetical protein